MSPQQARPKTTRTSAWTHAGKPREIARKAGRATREKEAAHQLTHGFIAEEARESGPPPRGTSEPTDLPEPPRRGED